MDFHGNTSIFEKECNLPQKTVTLKANVSLYKICFTRKQLFYKSQRTSSLTNIPSICIYLVPRSLGMSAQPSTVLATPPNFVLCANMLRVPSVQASRSLKKTLKSTRPSIAFWGTPLATNWALCQWSQHSQLSCWACFQSTSYRMSERIKPHF